MLRKIKSSFVVLILINLLSLSMVFGLDDVLVVGQSAEPKSLDPHAVTSINDFRIMVNLYDGLVR